MAELLTGVAEMQARAHEWRADGKRIALVPTMGFLHDAHASLLRAGRDLGDVLVLSIFVNPAQFGPKEDLDDYPRDLERDTEIAERVGVDVIFSPEPSDMYPSGYQTWVDVTGVTKELCGASRPGHFRGVTTVVSKLFNIVRPHVAVFGEKDFQQLVTIRRMVVDLNMGIEIVGRPIFREEDGLAMSSRNTYLDPEQRKNALALKRSLDAALRAYEDGERSAAALIGLTQSEIETTPGAVVDYISIVDADSIHPIEVVTSRSLLAVAVKFGETRLIDNVVLSATP